MTEPRMMKTRAGWLAVGDGWAVPGPTRDEALQRYRDAERRHDEIDARPLRAAEGTVSSGDSSG